MSLASKIYAIVVMLAFIVPNLFVIFSGQESFPFTQAPMFGHYIGDESKLYSFSFIAETEKKERQVYPSYLATNISDNAYTSRFFFNKIYKSVDEAAPFGRISNDSQDLLTKRMETFFATYFNYLSTDTTTVKKIRFEINQFNRKNTYQQKHLLGFYDLPQKKYTHLWKED